MSTAFGYLAFWLVLMVLAIANGALREATFARSLPELHAHQLSTVTGILLVSVGVWLLSLYWRPPDSARQALLIGCCWLVFTLAFEFIFGRYVVGHSWERLLHDYNVAAGRVWPLFLAWVVLLPYGVFRLNQ